MSLDLFDLELDNCIYADVSILISIEGRFYGKYLLTTKGIRYFNGGSETREPYRWNHVCASVKYKNGKAFRTIYVDGKLHYNNTSSYLKESSWPTERSLTFGGREIKYPDKHLNGYITDIQVFSRVLTPDEMITYTSCKMVNHHYTG